MPHQNRPGRTDRQHHAVACPPNRLEQRQSFGLIGVGLVAIVQLYVAGPMGLAMGLNRHWTAAAVFIGGMIGVVAFVFFGERIVDFFSSVLRRLFRRPPKDPAEQPDDEPGRFERLVDRFGAPLLGVAGPITIGGWAAAVLGTANGIGKLRLILWLAVGQAIVTVGYVYSLAVVMD